MTQGRKQARAHNVDGRVLSVGPTLCHVRPPPPSTSPSSTFPPLPSKSNTCDIAPPARVLPRPSLCLPASLTDLTPPHPVITHGELALTHARD